MFLTLRKLQSSAEYLANLVSRAVENSARGSSRKIANRTGRASTPVWLYGFKSGINASRYRHTRNSSRAVKTSAGGKPSGAISA